MPKIAFGLLMLALLSLALGLFSQDELGNTPLIAATVFFCWLAGSPRTGAPLQV